MIKSQLDFSFLQSIMKINMFMLVKNKTLESR